MNTPPHDPANPELEQLNDKLRLAGPQLASDIARLIGELLTQREAKAFNAGIEAALGAIGNGFDRAEEHPYEVGWNNALDQARTAIEELKSKQTDAL